MNQSDEVLAILVDLNRAISSCNLDESDVRIEKFEVSLLVEIKSVGAVKIEFKPIGLDIGGSYNNTDAHSFMFVFKPALAAVETLSSRSDSIKSALRIAIDTAHAVTIETPSFELVNCEIILKFVVDKDGKLQWFVGGSEQRTRTSTIKLYLSANVN